MKIPEAFPSSAWNIGPLWTRHLRIRGGTICIRCILTKPKLGMEKNQRGQLVLNKKDAKKYEIRLKISEEFTDFLLIPLKQCCRYTILPHNHWHTNVWCIYMSVSIVMYRICRHPRDLDSIAILLDFPFKKKKTRGSVFKLQLLPKLEVGWWGFLVLVPWRPTAPEPTELKGPIFRWFVGLVHGGILRAMGPGRHRWATEKIFPSEVHVEIDRCLCFFGKGLQLPSYSTRRCTNFQTFSWDSILIEWGDQRILPKPVRLSWFDTQVVYLTMIWRTCGTFRYPLPPRVWVVIYVCHMIQHNK